MTRTKTAQRQPVTRALAIVSRLLRGEALRYADIAETSQVAYARARELAATIADELDGAELVHDSDGPALRLEGFRVASVGWLDVVAAAMAASLGSVLLGTDLARRMKRLADLMATLSKDSSRFTSVDRKFVSLARGGEWKALQGDDDLTRIVRGLIDEHVIEAQYTKFGGEHRDVRIRPLSLVFYDHQLYVVAYKDGDDRPKSCRFSRFRNVKILETKFEYPDRSAYDPDVVFRSAFGVFIHRGEPKRIVLRLDARWAIYARTHRWHPSQVCEGPQPDGSVVVTLVVVPDAELEQFILSFGEQAEVLEPPELRQAIAARFARSHLRYGGHGARSPSPP